MMYSPSSDSSAVGVPCGKVVLSIAAVGSVGCIVRTSVLAGNKMTQRINNTIMKLGFSQFKYSFKHI